MSPSAEHHAAFQFTPLREGRPGLLLPRTIAYNFNSRPSARGDAPKWYCGDSANIISIHAPPRGATVHQNVLVFVKGISIHAPPRGATSRLPSARPPKCISIHAPPRGATSGVYDGAFRSTRDFNSRPSARGDQRMRLRWLAISFQFTPLREGRHHRRHRPR